MINSVTPLDLRKLIVFSNTKLTFPHFILEKSCCFDIRMIYTYDVLVYISYH